MSKKSRKFLIAGNWKMNLNSSEANDLAEDIISQIGKQTDITICMCPAFTSLKEVSQKVVDSNLFLGAQNMHYQKSGAFTGEISAEMLRHLYVTYVILGHSERRQFFGEDDEIVNKKVLAALDASLKPIICVGETLEEREQGKLKKVIRTQLKGALQDISPNFADNVVIAYEPVWAIGTGKTATPDMAESVHAFIRSTLKDLWGEEASEKVKILYGGSMKAENAETLLTQKNIDGGLIGGASLKAHSFNSIVEIAQNLS